MTFFKVVICSTEMNGWIVNKEDVSRCASQVGCGIVYSWLVGQIRLLYFFSSSFLSDLVYFSVLFVGC